MMKINDIKIIHAAVYALILLAILAVGVMAMPEKASASYNNVIPYESESFNNNRSSNNQDYYQETIYVQPKVVYVQPKIVYVEPKVVPASSNTVAAPQTTTEENTNADTSEEDSQVVSDLAANAVYGSNSFLPSGLIQWVLFAIIILIILILVRKISGADRKYHEAPLKHA